jgi:hypothetical protein
MWHICDRRKTHTLFRWGKPEIKRPLERPMHRLEDNTKINLEEIEWEGIRD